MPPKGKAALPPKCPVKGCNTRLQAATIGICKTCKGGAQHFVLHVKSLLVGCIFAASDLL